jgi:hypothetical protein
VKGASHTAKPISIKVTLADESEDEIYNELKEIQMRQKNDEKDRVKAMKQANKDIKSSTPTNARNSRKKINPVRGNLFLEISPIRANASNTELTQIDDGSSLQVPLFNTDLSVDVKESSNIQELKNMIADFRLNRELSAMNASNNSTELNIDSILREIQINKNIEPSPAESPPAKMEKVEPKKTVFFAPETENIISSPIKLKPGKWRKSLAAWRKSHAPHPSQRRTSRQFIALFPIRTDPNVIKRFTEKLEESLSIRKLTVILFFKHFYALYS